MTFGERIRKERELCSFSTEEASKELGVDRTTLYAWEMNKRKPSKKNVRKIAELYCVSVRELVSLL